jgi:putative endopeptidase
MGENIADQGGLRISRTAFLDAQKQKGIDVDSADALIDGYTPMQAFYLNYANIWATNCRDEEKRNLTIGDVHSLAENRVNVTLRNIAPFFEAFGIKSSNKLFRTTDDQVVIW